MAMIACAGPSIYLVTKAQQVRVAPYLNSVLNVFRPGADTIEIAQTAYRAITAAMLVLLMLFPASLYKRNYLTEARAKR
jgi:hypothetical protein